MSEGEMHLEDAMESKLAKIAVRIFVWITPLVIGLFAWFINGSLVDIKAMQAKQSAAQAEQVESLSQVKSDVKVLKATLDNGVIWRITEIERRLNTVEQAQRTP